LICIGIFYANFFRKTKTYLPPRFMTTSQAASQILESAKELQLEDSMFSFS
jgi:hypothetical protein